MGLIAWHYKRRVESDEQARATAEKNREEFEFMVVQSTWAAIALSEATARAVQRIPDAKCNGDMTKALEYAEGVKHSQKNYLAKQGIRALY
ncbi:MAG: serine/threonine protein kinase [Oscillospiraceae bacterium]|nr:serine/threonine protein kinase [Oscillospiraceae bacterium]